MYLRPRINTDERAFDHQRISQTSSQCRRAKDLLGHYKHPSPAPERIVGCSIGRAATSSFAEVEKERLGVAKGRFELRGSSIVLLKGMAMKQTLRVIWSFVLLMSPLAAKAQRYGDFTYTTDGSAVTITAYSRNASGGAVTIPSEITGLAVGRIGDYAFAWCDRVTSLTIPNSVTNIGQIAFGLCTGLTNVVISDRVTSIGGSAFQYCGSLPSITIPNSVTNLGEKVLAECTNLTAITVGSLNPSFSSLDGVLFDKAKTTLIQCPGGIAQDYVVPDGVTRILAMLRGLGATAEPEAAPPTPGEQVTRGYERFLTEERNLAPPTVERLRRFATRFLTATFGGGTLNMSQLGAPDVSAFVQEQAQRHGPSQARQLVSATRSFLRYPYREAGSLRHDGPWGRA
jgi:hypothetical protein